MTQYHVKLSQCLVLHVYSLFTCVLPGGDDFSTPLISLTQKKQELELLGGEGGVDTAETTLWPAKHVTGCYVSDNNDLVQYHVKMYINNTNLERR